MAIKCEIWFPKINRRGTAMLEAMIAAASNAGIDYIVTDSYRGNCQWLMTYGLGHVERRKSTQRHLENGGRLIGWDLGYWNRENTMRLTIDADHPWRLMRDMPSDRFDKSGFELRNSYNPNGHILLIGLGKKSRLQFGYDGQEWEKRALEKIQTAYPDHKVFYKPKKPEPFICNQIHGDIQKALLNCALVVCRHSNVSIDAALAGVPCVCEDGAGRYLYSNDLKKPINPTEAERKQFLNNVAYWQYTPKEAAKAWEFIKGVLNAN